MRVLMNKLVGILKKHWNRTYYSVLLKQSNVSFVMNFYYIK